MINCLLILTLILSIEILYFKNLCPEILDFFPHVTLIYLAFLHEIDLLIHLILKRVLQEYYYSHFTDGTKRRKQLEKKSYI